MLPSNILGKSTVYCEVILIHEDPPTSIFSFGRVYSLELSMEQIQKNLPLLSLHIIVHLSNICLPTLAIGSECLLMRLHSIAMKVVEVVLLL